MATSPDLRIKVIGAIATVRSLMLDGFLQLELVS